MTRLASPTASPRAMDKSPGAFRTISEVAEDLDLPQHVLRFWETRFSHIRPLKRGGGRRYYRPDDVDLLKGIRQLLYGEGYTIKGVQRILKEEGVRFVQSVGRGEQTVAAPRPPPEPGPEDEEPPEDGSLDRLEPSFEPAWHERPPISREAGHPAAASPVSLPHLTPADVDRLRLVLVELTECERVLSALKVTDELPVADEGR